MCKIDTLTPSYNSHLTCSYPILLINGMCNRNLVSSIFAESLSARLLIVQYSQFAFVCIYIHIYICMYVYLSHFNCMGANSVVSSTDY